MFLTNIGAVVAVVGSVLVLGAMALASFMRALGHRKDRPASPRMPAVSYRVVRRSLEADKKPEIISFTS